MTLKVRANTGGKDGLMEKLVRLMIILLFSTACNSENEFRSLSGKKTAGYGEGGSFTSVASQPSAGPSWVVERNQYGRLDVRVTDQAALDALLQSKWAAMKSALRAGDTAKAASYFTKDEVASYKNIFDNFTIPYSQIDIARLIHISETSFGFSSSACTSIIHCRVAAKGEL